MTDRKKLFAAAILLGIFISGVLSGILLDQFGLTRILRMPPVLPNPSASSGPPEQIIEMIAKDLELDIVQRQQLATILQEGAKAGQAIIEETRPKLKTAHDEVNKRIKSILNTKQKKHFNIILERLRRQGPPPLSHGQPSDHRYSPWDPPPKPPLPQP